MSMLGILQMTIDIFIQVTWGDKLIKKTVGCYFG